MAERKDKVTTVRFTPTQLRRIRIIAEERKWSISKTVQYIIDTYCNRRFKNELED